MEKAWIVAFVYCSALLSRGAGAEQGQSEGTVGRKPGVPLGNLYQDFLNPPRKFHPWAFWFWDHPLDIKELDSISERIMDAGMNPGYVHARFSLGGSWIGKSWKMDEDVALPESEWLSEKWFDAFRSVSEHAEKRGFQLGFVDEYWWPSGRAAGRVLKNNPELVSTAYRPAIRDVEGRVQVEKDCGKAFIAKISPNGKIISGTVKAVEPGALCEVGAGTWRLYLFYPFTMGGLYGRQGVNYLDRRLASCFIKEALEPYEKHLGRYFGKVIMGDFNDNEGDYSQYLPWSKDLEAEFKKRSGRELADCLPYLLDEDDQGEFPAIRCQWFGAISEIYTDYFGQLSDWCAARGLYFISNVWEENLFWQTVAAGDFMKIQRRVSFPGNDCLQDHGLDVTHFKETQSVCELDGKRFMSEVMGALNFSRWKPPAIKKISNSIISFGVDHIVPHGVFTSGKFKNNQWTPDWLDRTPYYRHLNIWSEFIARSSMLNAYGEGRFDTLLLNPLPSVWASCDKEFYVNRPDANVFEVEQTFPGDVQQIGARYKELMRTLETGHISYLIADGWYLDQMELKSSDDGPVLSYRGRNFSHVVLPPLKILPTSNLMKLVEFARQGGIVVAAGALPSGSMEKGYQDQKFLELVSELRSRSSFKTIAPGIHGAALAAALAGQIAPAVSYDGERFDLVFQHRVIEGADYVWLANNSGRPQDRTLYLNRIEGSAAELWDPETGKKTILAAGKNRRGLCLKMSFSEYQGVWVKILKELPREPERPAAWGGKKEIHPDMTLRIPSEAQPRLEYPVAIPLEWQGDGKPLSGLKDWSELGLGGFSGYADYRFKLELPVTGSVRLDLGEVFDVSELFVDGESLGKRFWKPHSYVIPADGRTLVSVIVRIGNSVNAIYGGESRSGLLGPLTVETAVGKQN